MESKCTQTLLLQTQRRKHLSAVFAAFCSFFDFHRRLETLLLFGLMLFCVPVRAEEISFEGGKVEVQFDGPLTQAEKPVATRWVQNAGRAVANYYGKFPVSRPVVRIALGDGTKARGGHASGWNGPRVQISLGRSATDETLADDWVLTHEMLHLCFPSLEQQHHWLEEGMATYCEPVARTRVGNLTAERVWGDMVEGMPQGEPQSGDRGLDYTHTWGRTYWGGALFCLQADVEIRRRTNNRYGFEHALRAIAAAGGTIERDWEIDRVIAVGDEAVGVPVLRELYDQMKATPVTVDLNALWKRLGVSRTAGKVSFRDDAPLAAVRKAITKPQ
jgi:hypothetical protein